MWTETLWLLKGPRGPAPRLPPADAPRMRSGGCASSRSQLPASLPGPSSPATRAQVLAPAGRCARPAAACSASRAVVTVQGGCKDREPPDTCKRSITQCARSSWLPRHVQCDLGPHCRLGHVQNGNKCRCIGRLHHTCRDYCSGSFAFSTRVKTQHPHTCRIG